MSNGQGSSCVYGRFWDDGRSQYAHRWAAKNIHGLDIDQPGTQVDHCCQDAEGRPRPNSLCVQHVQVVPSLVNLRLVWSRRGNDLEEEEAITDPPAPEGVPFFYPPNWLRPYLNDGNEGMQNAGCPF
jgi:hypothetical protein